MNRRATGAKNIAPQTIVQMKYDETGGNKDAATAALIDLSSTNSTLREFLIAKGARAAVGEIQRSDNANIYQEARRQTASTPPLKLARPADPGAAQRRALGADRRNIGILFQAVLPNGTRMADANWDDLQNAIQHYEPQARDMTIKVNYFKLVQGALPNKKKTCVEVFEHDDLRRLLKQAEIPA
jgi:hypothetical protein